MPAFVAPFTRQTHTSQFTLASLASSATLRRIALRRLIFSMHGTPADTAYQWVLQRITAVGTSTAVTPAEIDPGDTAAALTACGQNHSAEPTYTANKALKSVSLHRRATFHMEFAPGRELLAPAVQNNGFGIKVVGTAGADADADIEFVE